MACKYEVVGGHLPEEELEAYRQRAVELYGREPQRILARVDGDYVDLDYTFAERPMERIRRITGYLAGTMDRFSNGKRAEERGHAAREFQAQKDKKENHEEGQAVPL